ncbi:MAG: phosphodiesterase [Pseudomonadota bacterium]
MAVFAQITDLHLRPPGVLTQGHIDTDTFAVRAIDAVIAKHPDVDAVIVSGDVADLGEDGAYARAAELLTRFRVPVLVVPGNHDRTGPLREAFLALPGVADHEVPEKVCYAGKYGGVTVVMLDTSVDGLDTRQFHGELGEAQLAWLDKTLSAGGPTIIAMHHPPFDVAIGFMDEIGLRDAKKFSDIVARHSQVKRIVCGHVHRPIVGSAGGVPAVAIPGTAHQVELALAPGAPPKLVMEPPAYGIHMVDETGAISHIGYVDHFGAPESFGDG